MIGFPLDSHVEFDTDGTPIYDRAISSAPMRKLIKEMFSDGVLPNPSTNMQVSAGEGMNVIVSPGFALCNGCMKLEEAQRTLAVQASSTAYDRIDTVVLRLNDNDSERICDFYILQGVPATSPVRPTLTRTESIWELGLADLFITKNSTAVSNQRITDTRYEAARCGVMSSISQFDTTTLYKQVQADLAGFKAEEQADFIAWFENVKNQLSEDAAGNLQNQIDEMKDADTEGSLQNQINKLNGTTCQINSDLSDINTNIEKLTSATTYNNDERIGLNAGDEYTVPQNGYLGCCIPKSGGSISIHAYDEANSEFVLFIQIYNTSSVDEIYQVYVPKGMKLKVVSASTSAYARFTPIH